MGNLSKLVAIVATFVLCACGGGGSTSSDSVTSGTTPPVTSTTTDPTLPPFVNPSTITGSTINIESVEKTVLAAPSVNGAVDVSGTGNTVKIADNSQLGTLSVSGSGNNVIIGVGVTITNAIAISGSVNIVYVPTGTTYPSNITGSRGEVRYYKP